MPNRPRSRSRRISSERLGWPLVIKADGLAAGKGVVLVNDAEEAMAVVDEMLTGSRFGEAGRRIVLEECLVGPEVSFFVLSDGRRAMAIGSAQDHKRALDGDRGPNTGGMGAFAPSPLLTPELEAQVLKEVVHPVLAGMREEGHPYRGFLYCGLMLTAEGPMVIEFNARLGDPEAQVILPLVDEPLLPLLDAAAAGTLPDRPARLSHQPRVGVVVASGGYPDHFATGKPITGLADAAALDGVEVYHAGTAVRDDGVVVTSGGRVLTVVGRGADYKARSRARMRASTRSSSTARSAAGTSGRRRSALADARACLGASLRSAEAHHRSGERRRSATPPRAGGASPRVAKAERHPRRASARGALHEAASFARRTSSAPRRSAVRTPPGCPGRGSSGPTPRSRGPRGSSRRR